MRLNTSLFTNDEGNSSDDQYSIDEQGNRCWM